MNRKTILLVEDNADDETLTLRALAQYRVENDVVVARDGAEALDFLFSTGAFASKKPVLPQLVLLDLKLPKLDGIEVLRRIRGNRTTASIPVVILTSSSEEQDLVASYESGANSYIRKPVIFQEFIEAVRQLGFYWILLNEVPKDSAHHGH